MTPPDNQQNPDNKASVEESFIAWEVQSTHEKPDEMLAYLAGHKDGRSERDREYEAEFKSIQDTEFYDPDVANKDATVTISAKKLTALEAKNKKLIDDLAGNICGYCWDRMDGSESELTALETANKELFLRASTFLARAREGCEELNPNSYDADNALWKAEVALGRLLSEIEKAGEK